MGFLGNLLFGGKYERELKELEQKAAQEPKNLRLRVRAGDLLEKMGKRAEAVAAYHNAAKEYAKNGMLIQAIALDKVILRLDPARSGIHGEIAELYARWGKPEEEIQAAPEREMPSAAARPGALPPTPLFSDLKKEELSRVMEKIQARRFAKGKTVCREGDPGNSIYIISHGRVAVTRQPPGQEKRVLAELKEGEFFGEFAFFSNARRQATVETLAETELLEITQGDMEKIAREFPGVSKVLFAFYKRRVLDNILAASPLFQTFSSGERQEILEKVSLEEFPAETTVIEEGARGECMYILKVGEVEVFSWGEKKEKVILATLKEGDYFGEISLLTERPRTASVRTLRPSELVRLDKKDFDRIVTRHPETKKILEESLHARLESKLRLLGVFRLSPVKEGMV